MYVDTTEKVTSNGSINNIWDKMHGSYWGQLLITNCMISSLTSCSPNGYPSLIRVGFGIWIHLILYYFTIITKEVACSTPNQ